MFKRSERIIGLCVFLAAFFAPAAHAQTIYQDPGAVGGTAQDFSFSAGPEPSGVVDILWSDNKTLEYTSGTHLFLLWGPPCVGYAGVLLDAAGNAIPDAEVAGRTNCTAGSELSVGVIDVPAATVFSGIRIFAGAFNSQNAWQWTWDDGDRPVIGQTQVSGNQPPVADAGGPYEDVVGTPVTFDASASIDPDGTISSHVWDFGDGTSLGGETIQHTYTNAGKYHVILTVTDNEGLSQSTSTIADIGSVTIRPTADAGGPYTAETSVTVPFDGTGSTDPDNAITQYDWDFGDGSQQSGATPTKAYANAGTYYVVLTVTDATGNTDATVTVATITGGKQAPEADAGPPVEGVAGTAVSFDGSNSIDADGPIAQYAWDFGDGSPVDTVSGANPSHTYAAAGEYTVVLTVTDGEGVKDSDSTAAAIDANPLPPRSDAGSPAEGTAGVAVNFDGSNSSDADGTIAQYAWDFGDGSPVDTVSGANPSHTYAAAGSYTVTLTVTDNDGLTGNDTTQAAIGQPNSPPTADAGGPYAGIVNQPVLLAGAESSDADGAIVQYAWDFDDGNTGSGSYVSHTYTASGVYEVTLTVTDDSGDTDETKVVVVVGGGAIQPPTVFTTGPYNGVVGVPLTVDGSNSSDPDGIINTYDWAFGDGNTGTGSTSVNNYAASGLYAVTLQVTDDDGFTAAGGTIARIGNLSLPPNAVANDVPYKGRVGVPVPFNGGDSNDPDGTIDRYDWTFGDGNVANDAGATPNNTYATIGKYIVRLTVTDDSGESDTDIAIVNIAAGNLPPLAHTGRATVSGTVGNPVTFDGAVSSDPDGTIANYDWDFGDGNTGSGPNPTHSYATAGKYFVTLTVTDNDGAVNSDVTVADVTPASSSSGGSNGDNIFGCSIGSRDTRDPTLLLLALFAVLYLVRRRAGRGRM